jgi:ABC-type Fe3+ transport system substrate-binding protein
VSDILVYVAAPRAQVARSVLSAACRATNTSVRIDVYTTGALYQRLGPRKAPPFPDLVWFFGPYAARAAALDGFLQSYQPSRVADGAAHDPDWKWTAVDYSPISIVGAADPTLVSRLAVADPERSEAGLSILLASLAIDEERGWQWWKQRADRGLWLTEDDASALTAVNERVADAALTLQDTGSPLSGWAPLAHAIGLAASSRNPDGARQLLDWVTGPDAAGLMRYSPWQSSISALQTPVVDAEWGRQHYASVRQRWAASGFGPSQ